MLLWRWYLQQLEHKKSQRKLVQEMHREFLSAQRLREWQEIHGQLHAMVVDLGWRLNASPATYEQLHLALLSGLLGNIGCKSETEAGYQGARGIRFLPFPSSAGAKLLKATGKWIVCAELVETTKLYARTIARVEPAWIEQIAGHLVQTTVEHPRWDARSGQVVASQRGTLFGLVLYAQRRVDFARFEPAWAREIFLREALVQGDWDCQWPFLRHNLQLVKKLEQLEHRARRGDVVLHEDHIFAYYNELVPKSVVGAQTFDAWYKTASQSQPQLLFFSESLLTKPNFGSLSTDDFPGSLLLAGERLSLSYSFDPGSEQDGVTLKIPLRLLNQLPEQRIDWLVPGLLKNKIAALIKSLPQKPRARLQPVNTFIEQWLEQTPFAQGELLPTLCQSIRTRTGLDVKPADFRRESLPLHCDFLLTVFNERGQTIASSRNFAKLKADLAQSARQAFREAVQEAAVPPQGAVGSVATATLDLTQTYTDWGFGQLPFDSAVALGQLSGFPALVDQQQAVRIQIFDTQQEAASVHRQGLLRLFALQLREPIKAANKTLQQLLSGVACNPLLQVTRLSQDELRSQIIDAALAAAFLSSPLPSDQASFHTRLQTGKQKLQILVAEFAKLMVTIASELHGVTKRLGSSSLKTDIEAQLQGLLLNIRQTDYEQLRHFPRYLRAINLRLDKLRNDPARDAERMRQFRELQSSFQRELALRKGSTDKQLTEFRWLLEELRVSLFAQELKTPTPVSVKRLEKLLQSLRSH